MLVTTSKRPGHRSRVLGRELANVVFNSVYLPRGTKTLARLAELAGKLGQSRVVIVNSVEERPWELRFLEVGRGWKWANVKILLERVELQRELGQRIKLAAAEIYSEGGDAKKLAQQLGSLMGLPLTDELGSNAAVFVGPGDEKLIQFWTGKSKVGPRIYIRGFEELRRRGSD
jgi:hypothetical protein